MIRRAWNKDKWLLTQQMEHARIAGLIAASWNFHGNKPHEEVFQAILRHDDGWKEVDEQPTVNEAGAPTAFDEMDLLDSFPIWSACAKPLVDEQRHYSARLVAAHFVAMARKGGSIAKMSPRKVMEVGKFIGEQQALIKKCTGQPLSSPASPNRRNQTPTRGITVNDMKFARPEDAAVRVEEPETNTPEDTFERDLRFLQVCDMISIFLCSEFFGEIEIEDVPFLPDTTTLKVVRQADNLSLFLSPLPFKKNLRDHVMSYVVQRKIYDTDDELRSAIQATRPASNEIHIGAA